MAEFDDSDDRGRNDFHRKFVLGIDDDTFEALPPAKSSIYRQSIRPRKGAEVRRVVNNKRRVSLSKVTSEMIGTVGQANPLELVSAQITHQVVQMAVAYYKARHVPSEYRQLVRNIYESHNGRNVRLVETAISLAASQPPLDPDLKINLTALAQQSPAALKYDQKAKGRDERGRSKRGTQTLMFTVSELTLLLPQPDYRRIAAASRPAAISLVRDETLMSSPLYIESKHLFPVSWLGITLVHVFDFLAHSIEKGYLARDLKTYDPGRLDKWKLAVQTYAVARAAKVASQGGTRHEDLWGEDDRAMLTVAHANFEDIDIQPGERQSVIVIVHPKDRQALPLEVSFDQEMLLRLSRGLNDALVKLVQG